MTATSAEWQMLSLDAGLTVGHVDGWLDGPHGDINEPDGGWRAMSTRKLMTLAGLTLALRARSGRDGERRGHRRPRAGRRPPVGSEREETVVTTRDTCGEEE